MTTVRTLAQHLATPVASRVARAAAGTCLRPATDAAYEVAHSYLNGLTTYGSGATVAEACADAVRLMTPAVLERVGRTTEIRVLEKTEGRRTVRGREMAVYRPWLKK